MTALRVCLLLALLTHPVPNQAGEQTPDGALPAGAERVIWGELIEVDHVNRQGVLRVDRGDDQTRGQWDRPLPFALFPFGTVSSHGAPADLRDIPLGTHLRAEFFEGEPVSRYEPMYSHHLGPRKTSPYLAFTRVSRLEDDFSYASRTGRLWRIEAVQPDSETLMVVAVGADGTIDARPTKFELGEDAHIWKGRSVCTLDALQPGQTVVLNLTACTLTGPGRCTDIWIDDESRAVATRQQFARHRYQMRQHGLVGLVDGVDNQAGKVSVMLFGGMDPVLYEDFLAASLFRAAVADDSLRTYDQVNDSKEGPGTAVRVAAEHPGASGVRVTFQPSLLLEGFRPGKIVRLWPRDPGFKNTWNVGNLPREEALFRN
ncbi:hypothetical protein [Planctomicrobium sp. SH664]|uniref:hypothetical protein n=1 Tax=Planctomicrobium sp. SH664 TaxID=3448125 RepID=UPI003F5B7EEB